VGRLREVERYVAAARQKLLAKNALVRVLAAKSDRGPISAAKRG
jgi:hypothetical protein